MSFKTDVEATPDIAAVYESGLQALRKADKDHITATKPKNLAGSVDIDSALKKKQPTAARWDYVVARKDGSDVEKLYWVEVHPASSTGNIQEIEKKLSWLQAWLAGAENKLDSYPRDFVWLASGKSVFTQGSPQLKTLAAKGLMFKGGHLTIPG